MLLRTRSVLALLALIFIGLGAAPPAMAGLLVLSGDSNIIEPIDGSDGAPVLNGNKTFFKNVLQGGTRVVILDSTAPFLGNVSETLSAYYNSLGGVTSTVVTGTVSAATLAGANLFVSVVPDDAFSPAETAALGAFLGIGGTVFFLGENSNSEFVTGNNAINSALTALGSAMRIVPADFDPGFNVSTISASPLTAGTAGFEHAAPSRVTGGTLLYSGTGGERFVAYEGNLATTVPLPSTLLLVFSAALGFAWSRARPRLR